MLFTAVSLAGDADAGRGFYIYLSEGLCLMNIFSDFLELLRSRLETFGISDVIDILLLSALFFFIYRFIRKRRAFPVFIGLVVFIAAHGLLGFFGLDAAYSFIDVFYIPGIIVSVVIFQDDIRAFLEKTGTGVLNFFRILGGRLRPAAGSRQADSIVKAVTRLSASRTGALIVLEKSTGIDDVSQSGIKIDALISSELICNLFFAPAPLHDGAIIIRRARIYAAGCFLPNYTDPSLSASFGSRHRAAIGMSRTSDAGVIVVSEEDGRISYAEGGELSRGIDENRLRKILDGYYGVSRRAVKEGGAGK